MKRFKVMVILRDPKRQFTAAQFVTHITDDVDEADKIAQEFNATPPANRSPSIMHVVRSMYALYPTSDLQAVAVVIGGGYRMVSPEHRI